MATKLKLQEIETPEQNVEDVVLETRKVKALEKIANSLDALIFGLKKLIKKNGVKELHGIFMNFIILQKME